MTRAHPASRPLTLLAFGFLLIDAVLLTLAGLWSQRGALLVLGAVFGLAAVGVLVYWRAHQKRLAEIDEARRKLKAEAEALRDLVKDK
jgi:hypothetical protein